MLKMDDEMIKGLAVAFERGFKHLVHLEVRLNQYLILRRAI